MTARFRSLGLVLLGAACVPGCAAARSARAPSATPPPPEAAASSAPVRPNLAPSAGAGAPPTATAAEPMPVDDLRHAQSGFDESARAFAAAGSDCAQMCRALASMQRAAEHLCELTKDGGDLDRKRCTEARDHVGNARDRVQSSCGACATP